MIPAWAIFISGRGSNAQALLDLSDEIPVRLVVSSRDQVWGLARARRRAIPTLVLERKIDWNELQQKLLDARIDRIFLLGFMRIVPATFIEKWKGRIFNLHPSLLPAFPGLHAIEKSHEARGKMGVTVHEVIPEMDAGPIILQKQTLERAELCQLSSAQFLISRDEQRLVRIFALGRSRPWLE